MPHTSQKAQAKDKHKVTKITTTGVGVVETGKGGMGDTLEMRQGDRREGSGVWVGRQM